MPKLSMGNGSTESKRKPSLDPLNATLSQDGRRAAEDALEHAGTLIRGRFTEPTDLDASGNFKINSALSAIPPNPCAAPILLIRNYANGSPGSWFAAGIQKIEDDD
jgi:hypothetical protein